MKINDHISKSYILLIFLLFVTQIVFVQESQGQQSEDYVIKPDGERIDLYGIIKIDGVTVKYDNEKGKSKYLKQKHIEYMIVYNRLYLNLKATSIAPRIHEIIAFNSDYILTAFWDNVIRLYVWDKDFNAVETNLTFLRGLSGKVDKNQAILKEQVAPYFVDCPDLMELLNTNIAKSADINKGISYYDCNSSLKPLEIYLKNKK